MDSCNFPSCSFIILKAIYKKNGFTGKMQVTGGNMQMYILHFYQ